MSDTGPNRERGFRRIAPRPGNVRWWVVAVQLCWLLPVAGTALALEDGASGNLPQPEQVYRRHCAACHGERGDGRTQARANLVPPPRDFTNAAARALSRERMIAVARNGKPGTAMASWKTRLKASEVVAVVDYIRGAFMEPASGRGSRSTARATREADVNLASPLPGGLAGNVARGGRFYAANCATCHGASGDGQGPRVRLLSPKPRSFGDAAARARLSRPVLFAAIAAGKVGTDMPAWDKVLTDQEIADVAEYVFRAYINPEVTAKLTPGNR